MLLRQCRRDALVAVEERILVGAQTVQRDDQRRRAVPALYFVGT
jgi:hypothetical protein